MTARPKRPPTRPASRRERRAQARFDNPTGGSRRAARAAPRPAWQSPVVLVTGAALLIGIAIVALARPPAPATAGELVTPPTAYGNLVRVDGDVLGVASAPVVMQLYADFQCPACKLFVTTELPRLLTDFVQQGTLRIEARDIEILDRGSSTESRELAVGAACAAEQNLYWPFHDLVFWNQGRENQGDHSAEFIARVATAAHLDMTTWQACIGRADIRAAVDAATSAALAAGVNATPTIIVNGQSLVGVPEYATLADLIRQLTPSVAPATGAASPAASPS